ncbi:MAG: hypothetical protein J6I85_03845 [Clostridia bacterium]|nr:hypothetical protein [Clostridia bacterium]
MLKNLIIIENGKDFQYDTLEEVTKALIDKDFYNMTEVEKMEKMRIKALANNLYNKFAVLECSPLDGNFEGKFIIQNEITYIYSLLMNNSNLLLLEHKNSNILTKYLNKEFLKDNYVIVNSFAKELLEKYVKEQNML